MKTCCRCGTETDASGFMRDKSRTDGLRSSCKTCDKKSRAEFYQRNKVRLIRDASAYYERNKVSVQNAKKVFREKHKEEIKAYLDRYRADNPAKIAAGWRANYLKYREEKLAYNKSTREQRRDVIRNGNNRRHARKRNCEINDFTGPQWTAMKAAYDGRCAYCGVVPDRLTQDHVIPLSKGGNHTESNIVPACMPCNNHKKTREAPPRVVIPQAAPASATVSVKSSVTSADVSRSGTPDSFTSSSSGHA